MNRSLHRTALVLFGSLLWACGGGAPDVDQAFRRIQVHEATIAHHAEARERCVAGEPCPAEETICDAASGICSEAELLNDRDARARCQIARERCGTAP